MYTSPEECPFRTPARTNKVTTAQCTLVSRITGITDPDLCTVQRDACEACCQSLRSSELINPVVASLVYGAASRVIQACGHQQCSVAHAQRLMQYATDQLSIMLDELPEARFPPDLKSQQHCSSSAAVPQPELTWAVGLLTAPRGAPTIDRTIRSLRQAGFERIHVFAEPQSWIPAECDDLPVTIHRRRLGNFVNFYSSLAQLLNDYPSGDVFAIFQDDVEAAAGLKQWCDQQLWPLDAGIVSLFTPFLHSSRKVGWNLLSPGFHRVCGAQALVLRRDVLQAFLSDPLVIRSLQIRTQGDDAVVAAWVAREGKKIAYHTPSLVQHIGKVSSIYPAPDGRVTAHAVSSVEHIHRWVHSNGCEAKIGLVGWNTPTGLGYQNRDLATHLGIDRWFIPDHPDLPSLPLPAVDVRMEPLRNRVGEQELRVQLQGLDWIVFAERPYLHQLVGTAATSGIALACIPNWEQLHPELGWLQFIDLMICPTHHTFLLMTDWKHRYGFGFEVVEVPWPVDVGRFRFQQREICRRFLFINGWGGGQPRQLDGSPAGYGRKGLEVIVQAARLAPHLPFVVYSQTTRLPDLPSNIQFRRPERDNLGLYDHGDVCVQPSHFEGLGLQLLECQAAGMPLVTTDGPPMNEHQPYRTIPVCATEVVSVHGGPVLSHLVHPRDLIETLEPLLGADIRAASRQARRFVEQQHSWDQARAMLRAALAKRK